ncbi:hypothetical protein V6N12_064257 [Hibiscus sabdariffa]|uniref:RNase H type-1 domain-containing protein n=1 Tax=Hibiscus sabdariffa TaxID=183260 RepID=A0ABR2G6I1_9ROSI
MKYICSLNGESENNKEEKEGKWKPWKPSHVLIFYTRFLLEAAQGGWIKANADGACNILNNAAAAGGVFHYEHGAWIFGFTRTFGHLLGSHSRIVGSSWCYGACMDRVLVRQYPCRRDPREWEVKIQHVQRDLNMVADKLASLSRNKQQ